MASKTVLIIEDNLVNLKLARLLLTLDGYEVKTAVDAEEALSMLKGFHPKIILMDLQLPGKNGLDLTQEIKASPNLKDICIVALTASAMKNDEQRALAAGCDGYIAKPISAEHFSNQIANYIKTYYAQGKRDNV